MAEFEGYRQPWETGPHWELKREFMEKYQNDFPLDRLLCLAQAYSNIELLHCSYPEPVMREVYQLSCQLQGCKRFREADADLERRRKEKAEMQPRKAGKRSLYDEVSTKPVKFIKFRSAEEASDQSKSNNESDKNSNDIIQCDNTASTNDARTSDDSDGLKKDSVSEEASSDEPAAPSKNNNIVSLVGSPDFGLMQKIAAAIPERTGTPLGSIESAIEMSGLENQIKYVFVRENKSVISCQFYVGSTLVSTGRDATEKFAKERAIQYGFEVLKNLSNLPYKTLEDVKQELENWKKANWNSGLWSEISSSDLELKSKMLRSQLLEMEKKPAYADLQFILSIVEKILQCKKNKHISALQKIQEAAAKLKCVSKVHYFYFGEDPDTLLHRRVFHCDFVIKNIFICQSKASVKKKAKNDASEQGFNFLINFIENCELEKQQNVQEQVQSLETNFESSKHIASAADKMPENYKKTFVPSNGCDSQSGGSKFKPKLFQINHRLLTNSRNWQLIIYDLSENCGQKQMANSMINISASRCKKSINYKTDEIFMDNSRNPHKIYRCSITLNKEEIGNAQGFTEKEAKSNAAEIALQFLQNHVYTVKVKNEIDESFIISRSHVLNAENPSSVLSESNVGCKMLKMMGWTGGGIGKTSGITEPIVANDHRFGQGLGFSNDKAQERSFKQKVNTLLKDYSQSNTTSDLIFSTEFNKAERKEIHQLAARYNLSTVSRGKNLQRQLFIGRKMLPMELLELLIKAGGSTPKYELEDRSVSDRTSVAHVQGWQSETLLFR